MMRLYNLTDLHLDKFDYKSLCKFIFDLSNKLVVDTTYYNILALTGDITSISYENNKLFFDFVSSKFNLIIYVPGNHEYYNITRTHVKQIEKEFIDFFKHYSNIIFLNNKIYILDSYVFVGTTLWSNVSDNNKNKILFSMNDYNYISIQDLDSGEIRRLNVDDTNYLHQQSVHFLSSTLKNKKSNPNLKYIVLTHHVPIFSKPELNIFVSDKKYLNNSINEAYQSQLDHLINSPIILWCFGHTHYNSLSKYNDVFLWNNYHKTNVNLFFELPSFMNID